MVNITRTSTPLELVTYHHQSLGFPLISSVLRALSHHPDELYTNLSRNEQAFDQQTSSTSYINLQRAYGQGTNQPQLNNT